ncbi:MAG: SUMF1/EgtB/PvdO family nonheme iron enzyme [Deltaproteobacteria bacterium]|nr:SUMF1/EgtB/PvdO family nonheme iron enzyme [Deltaproteobacteria bacterium]
MSTKLEFSRGDVIASRYEVIDLLDEGPLGFSYRVKHLKSGKFLRLTMLRPRIAGREQKDQLLASFKAAREIQHPGLIKVGELGEHDGVAFYTMEDFEGGTLRELIQEYRVNNEQFAVKDAAQIIILLCEALQQLHEAGMVIRGLRPEYVLIHVRRTGPRRQNFVAQIKVLGAGFWDLIDAGTLAEDEFTRGEAQYLAPELKSFEPASTPRCDVYTAGVIFYEMLTGSAPVGTFQLPGHVRPDLPTHVNDVVEMALANAPDDRYPSSADLALDIQRIFQGADAADEPTKRNILWSVLGWSAALILVGAVAIAVLTLNTKNTPEKTAIAKDKQLQAQILEAHPMLSEDEVKAILTQHPPNMAYIPAGPYISGRNHAEFDASPTEPLAAQTEVSAYLIDIFEYPNFKDAPPQYGVSFTEAEKLCEDAGKRLCTTTEWEKACKGPLNLIYSYGDAFDPEFCDEGLESVYKSGSHANCKSGWGVYDMSGNFKEWTATAPQGKDARRIVKGGLLNNPVKGTRCAFSLDESISFKEKSMGFRCCRDVSAPPWTPPAPAAPAAE